LAVGALAAPLNLWVLGAVLVVAGVALGIGQPLTMTVIPSKPRRDPGHVAGAAAEREPSGSVCHPGGVGLVAAAAGVAGVFGVTAAGLALVAGGSWYSLRNGKG
jgi:nitrate/nitrite transporter NarK